MHTVIIGQEEVLEKLILALVADGHVLLEGMPGLAKTLMIKTLSDESYPLEPPFLVMATQNPIETQGTYELPEAQVDRFMFKILLDYPTQKQEQEIIRMIAGGSIQQIRKIISPSRIIEIQRFNHRIYMDEKISKYITDIVQATRKPEEYGLEVKDLIEHGASPRASIYMALGGKAHAMLSGRGYVIPEDIKAIAKDVLRHRIILTYEAMAEEITSDKIITSILYKVPVP